MSALAMLFAFLTGLSTGLSNDPLNQPLPRFLAAITIGALVIAILSSKNTDEPLQTTAWAFGLTFGAFTLGFVPTALIFA